MNTTLLKNLRAMTGAGIVDCKTALEVNNGDLNKAKSWLVERSKTIVEKISDRTVKSGLIGLKNGPSAGALLEVNCETDFVARGNDFQDLVRGLTEQVLGGSEPSNEDVTSVAGRIKENIVVGSHMRLETKAGRPAVLGSYLHNQLSDGVGTAGAIVALEGNDSEEAQKLARALAVHIVGARPPFLSRDAVPMEMKQAAEEKIMAEAGPSMAGKPEKAVQGMLQGRLSKYFEDVCLLEQSFMFGELEGTEISAMLGKHELQVTGFIRAALGGEVARIVQ